MKTLNKKSVPSHDSFWSNKRIYVTGGGGFLGSFVVKKLNVRGDTDQLIDFKVQTGFEEGLQRTIDWY